MCSAFLFRHLKGAIWRNRYLSSDNSAADAAANWALDHGSFMNVWATEIQAFIHQLVNSSHSEIGLVFSFDGASRGNPGPSASGVCAWWGTWHLGAFHARGTVLQKGSKLGFGTNYSAKASGLATMMKTSLRLQYWVIQQLTLAQPSSRHE